MNWEEVKGPEASSAKIWRTRVYGGWLVYTETKAGVGVKGDTIFIPDPKQLWSLEEVVEVKVAAPPSAFRS